MKLENDTFSPMKYSSYIMTFMILLNFSCKQNTGKIREGNSTEIKDTQVENDRLASSIERGETIYNDFCVQCHMADGKGIKQTFPPLSGSNWLTDKREESIRAVKFGQSGEILVNGEPYNSVMIPMGLSDEEVADVLNYVMNSWENTEDDMVTPEEVSGVTE